MEVLILDSQILLELLSNQNIKDKLNELSECTNKHENEEKNINKEELNENSNHSKFGENRQAVYIGEDLEENLINYWRNTIGKIVEECDLLKCFTSSQKLFDIDFQDLKLSVILVSSKSSYRSNLEAFKLLKRLNQFDDLVIYDERLTTEVLEEIICKYEADYIDRYQMLMLSCRISNLEIASQCKIRVVFYSEIEKSEEYRLMEFYKPEFDVFCFRHLTSVINQLNNDFSYIKANYKASLENNSIYDCYQDLPSQKVVNVGVKVAHLKRPISSMIKNGFFFNSDKVKYKTICLEAPLEFQGPFDLIICKMIDYYDDNLSSNEFEKALELEEFCEINKIPLFDRHIPAVTSKFRNLFYNVLADFLLSEEYTEISQEFKEVLTIPKIVFISSAENVDKKYFLSKIKEESIIFPLIVKVNKCYGSILSHAKYLVNSTDGVKEIFNNKEFIGQDLMVEELIPHSDELQIKVQCVSNMCMFWRICPSICESLHNSDTYITSNYDVFSDKCFNIIEDVRNETRFNIKFVHKITMKLMECFEATFIAFDFIISTANNSYVLIDVNYFPPCGRINSDLVAKYLNEFCVASANK